MVHGRRTALTFVAALTLAASLGGCNRRRETPSTTTRTAPAADAQPRPLRQRPKTAAELPTTNADIYLGNLDGQIRELMRLTAEAPGVVPNVQRLSGALHTRGRFRGDLDEIQLGIDHATVCLRLEPTNGDCHLMRGDQEQSLHRFKEARADLEKARALGVKEPARLVDLETELDWNDGLYDKSIDAIRKARRDRPSTATWMREAQLEHDLGLDDASDAAFEAAEDLVSDTAPLPVAHLDVQRGIQKAQRGQLEAAVVFFREAAARMPTYVAANEHLAETLHVLGRDDEAIAIYEKVVAASSDPEFAHALGVLYAARGKEREARVLEKKARDGYEALLVKYPEAMYWHASEFFFAIGDKKRALELLQKNVTLRPNSTSYTALARAELANGRTAEAKAAIDKALAMPLRSASLFWTASLVARALGNVASADTFADKATHLNPRIATDGP